MQTATEFKNKIKYISGESEGRVNQPRDINVQLFDHQRSIVHRMQTLENDKNMYTSDFRFGVLSDFYASGKTIDVLSLISIQKELSDGEFIKYGGNRDTNRILSKKLIGAKYSKINNSNYINSNVVVVPHSIIKQWMKCAEDFFPNLKCYSIMSRRNIISDTNKAEKYSEYDVIFVKNTMYKVFVSSLYFDSKVLKNSIFTRKIEGVDTNAIRSSARNLFRSIASTASYSDIYHVEEIEECMREMDKGFSRFKSYYNKLEELKSFYDNNFKHIVDKFERERQLVHINNFTGTFFNRVFFDEADTINIPNCPQIHAIFTWFISSGLDNFIHAFGNTSYAYTNNDLAPPQRDEHIAGISNKGFILDTFTGANSIMCIPNMVDTVVVQSTKEYLKRSIFEHIPHPKYNIHECATPNEIGILSGLISTDMMECMNADNIQEAADMIDVTIGSRSNIVQHLIETNTRKIQRYKRKQEDANKKIETHKNHITRLRSELDVLSRQNNVHRQEIDIRELNVDRYLRKNEELKEDIKKWGERIENLDNMNSNITDRIKERSGGMCSICMDPLRGPSLCPDCQGTFCLECITLWLNKTNNKRCPMCRTHLEIKDLCVIETDEMKDLADKNNNNLLSKYDFLKKIITERGENQRFLIYSGFEKSFDKIETFLKDSCVIYSLLKGSSSTIQKNLNLFKDGEISVLLMNAKYYGTGLNIPFCTDIVFYHRMDRAMENQIIGRGQRIGRTDELNVHFLVHSNESNDTSTFDF